MKRQWIFYLLVALSAFLFLSCGDSEEDDEVDLPTTPTTTTSTVTDEPIETAQATVDFAQEEVAIRELFASHAVQVTEQEVAEIMDHWLKVEKPDVFMAWNFWNAFSRIDTWSGVKNSFAGTFEQFANPLTATVTEVGIDRRAKNATLRADYNWLQAGKLVAAFQKDNKGAWKIQAIDFSDKDLVKWIETPEAE